MADYNEAIKNLRTIQGMPLTIRLAIEALEKQVPKKPDMTVEENYLGEYTFYHCDCPTCGKFLEGGRTRHPHHCPCGQALLWEDVEQEEENK